MHGVYGIINRSTKFHSLHLLQTAFNYELLLFFDLRLIFIVIYFSAEFHKIIDRLEILRGYNNECTLKIDAISQRVDFIWRPIIYIDWLQFMFPYCSSGEHLKIETFIINFHSQTSSVEWCNDLVNLCERNKPNMYSTILRN